MNEEEFHTVTLYEAIEAVRKTKGAVTERDDNRLGRKIWCARFTIADGDMSPARVLWLDGPPAGEWFKGDDAKWFLMAIGLKRNVSVKFDTLAAACAFMTILKGCEAAQ